MSSEFAALEDALSDAADAVFGELFEHRPFAAAPGGGVRSADDTRPVVQVIGIYEAPVYKSTEFGSEARGSLPMTTSKPTLSVDARNFPAGRRPRAFDRFLRLSTADLFEVSDVEADAEGRLKFALKRLGREQS